MVVSNSLSFVRTGRTQRFQFENPLVFSLETVKNKLNKQGRPTHQTGICHLHICQNASCLPPKILHSIVFKFSRDGCNTQKKRKTKVMQNWGGGGGQGVLREICK